MNESNESPKSLRLAGMVVQRLSDGNGYSWSYASRLGQMLAIAEAKFGERDQTYTLLGVEFAETGPQLWYPGNRKHIVIQLSLACLMDERRGCYQLAHECIHLLSPTGQRQASVLEEGLATYFSAWFMQVHMKSIWHAVIPSYLLAESLVKQLLAIDPYAVKVLRAAHPSMNDITKEFIQERFPTLSEAVAEQLCNRFVRE